MGVDEIDPVDSMIVGPTGPFVDRGPNHLPIRNRRGESRERESREGREKWDGEAVPLRLGQQGRENETACRSRAPGESLSPCPGVNQGRGAQQGDCRRSLQNMPELDQMTKTNGDSGPNPHSR